ncbi:phosphoribosylformylglycinamidine synthase subunit PurS [Virgibacillus dakarensis]|uniref:Phosphoribosylformylglycinamidine synthase subunit PurS n=1 Tax=Lentibacillus populi TaxID=1827502 RepID=A0A9W5TZ79_9BACI|nr:MULTISPECIES: phosphoribosylformylglycinamidine synthase subunit PurS [Bacillaceae]MBT2217445.1 phosphoribosylformylglycinamidine synthase subunit PurS [Virgibacillus dakarensis]MTW86279.1 phosphoribosylformylglycinamidine synthase subunit PurS [Virgibacillus dakarensis]GGB50166.1 phosphoribosylformylglycinamidine synthase subunit PurS [Lentibacillus populi]
MKKVIVFITLKQGVLDPQGKAVQTSLHSLGFQEVEEARIGKYIELYVEDQENVSERVQAMCEQLLANPVIEDYRFEIEEAVHS